MGISASGLGCPVAFVLGVVEVLASEADFAPSALLAQPLPPVGLLTANWT